MPREEKDDEKGKRQPDQSRKQASGRSTSLIQLLKKPSLQGYSAALSPLSFRCLLWLVRKGMTWDKGIKLSPCFFLHQFSPCWCFVPSEILKKMKQSGSQMIRVRAESNMQDWRIYYVSVEILNKKNKSLLYICTFIHLKIFREWGNLQKSCIMLS